MTRTESDLQRLLGECDVIGDHPPAQHLMPNFDALAWEWLNQEHIPNSHIMDEFSIWCDMASQKTYAIIKSVGGFFRNGAIFGGGLQLDVSDEVSEKICIAGYCWESDGTTWTLSNTARIEDELNEAWCDCDDWLFGPCFFMDINPDGTIRERKPVTFPPREKIEKALFNLGFRRPDHETAVLESLVARSDE